MNNMLVGLMDVSGMFDDDTLYQRCMGAVSEERRTRAAKYKSHKDSCRSIGAAVLLNVILRRYVEGRLSQSAGTGVACGLDDLYVVELSDAADMVRNEYNWDIRYSDKGKPEFDCEKVKERADAGCAKPVYFNMSHAGNYVACVVSDSCVGIDIEGKRKISESVAKRYFTDAERKSIQTDKDFFRLWTFKEALGKYSGQGIMSSIQTSEDDVKDSVSVNRYEYGGYQICVVSENGSY